MYNQFPTMPPFKDNLSEGGEIIKYGAINWCSSDLKLVGFAGSNPFEKIAL